ncbi:MAG: hypothetical protein IIA45_07195 [Bacteroidetes bacterium]|nr:hypothetical protein [Bacteroidota bacterium]
MSSSFQFTFNNIQKQFQDVLAENYKVITCAEYVEFKGSDEFSKLLINRVDIDFNMNKARRLMELFNALDIKATFFIRLHAPEYNPFSFENYKILKAILSSGHEVGYHSEIVDQAAIWEEDAAECLTRDLQAINNMLGIEIKGVASHGGMTGLNNLDFWKDRKPSEFGLLYEAYDKQPEFNLFQDSFYISDSNWTSWKCYDKGELVENNDLSLGEHAKDNHELIYSLIHSDTYFDEHFYE